MDTRTLGGKALAELWDAIKHEKVQQQNQSKRCSGRLFKDFDLPPVIPLGCDENVVVGEKDDHDGEGIVQQGKVPKMNRWCQEFVDGALEEEYQCFFDVEHKQRSTHMSLLLFVLGIGLLVYHYSNGAGTEEIAITHAVHFIIFCCWGIYKLEPQGVNLDLFLLAAETIALILAPLRTYYIVHTTETHCWQGANNSNNTVLAKYEALECIVSARLGFGACSVYVIAILVACVSLRKFKHFLFASVVLNASFAYVYLVLLSFPVVTVLLMCILLSAIFGALNRAIDKFMRKDFLWYVDTISLLRFHMNGMEKGKQHRERIVAYLFHEVRNPINNISLAVQAASSLSQEFSAPNAPPTSEVLEDLQQLTEVVSNAAQAATHVLNDALDLEKLAAGSFTFVAVAFQFEELCSGVVRSIQARFAAKDIEVTVRIDPELAHFTVLGDLHRLQQVLQNFLSNAAKFTPKGGKVRLEIQTLRDCSPMLPRPPSTKTFLPARVAVSDTGPGLTPDEQKLLFKPFSQIRAGEMQGGGGTGLGLSLSKDFIQRGHNGRIGVKSPGLLNTGSTFFFDINYPMASVAVAPKATVATPRSSFARRLSLLTPRVFDSQRSQDGSLPKQSQRSVSVSGSFKKNNSVELTPTNRRRSLESTQVAPQMMMSDPTLSSGPFRAQNGAGARALFGSSGQVTHKGQSCRTSLGQSSTLFAEEEDGRGSSHQEDTVVESVTLTNRRPLTHSRSCSECTLDLLSEPDYGEFDHHNRPTGPAAGGVLSGLSSEDRRKKKKRVLVVEDSSITRKLMTRALVKLGVEVETAENGQIACDIMAASAHGHLSLLFMDKEMPVMDGMEATKALRAAGHTLPIIAVTGNVQQQQQEEFLEVGATEVLAKPISSTELVSVLKRHHLID